LRQPRLPGPKRDGGRTIRTSVVDEDDLVRVSSAERGGNLASARYNLTAMVAAIQGAGAKPLIVGMKVPPNYGAAYARTFDALFVDVAKARRTPIVPYVFEGFGEDLALFQGDRIHPTAAAQTRILDNVWPVLVPLLARK
jgi:acyl-CoA thioesterase-1